MNTHRYRNNKKSKKDQDDDGGEIQNTSSNMKRKATGIMDTHQNNKKSKRHQDDGGERQLNTSGIKRKTTGLIKETQKNKKTKKHQADDNGETLKYLASEFPDIFVSKILSLFTTEHGSRFRLISKTWDRLWSSVPVIDLDEFNGNGNKQQQLNISMDRHKNFIKFVQRCLKLREKDKFTIERFKLRMRYLRGGGVNIHKWLRYAVQGNVLQELSLCLVTKLRYDLKGKCFFHLAPDILKSAPSLSILKLENVIIDSDSIDLPSLKNMSLKRVAFTRPISCSDLLSGCPLIEHLFLSFCEFTSSSKLSSPCLKSLQVMPYVSQYITKLEAESLESLSIHCHYEIPFIKDVSYGKKLTSLEFRHNLFLRSSWFEDLDSRFPLLESLTLHACSSKRSQGRLNISSQHLKRFQVFYPYAINLSTTFPNLLEAVIVLKKAILKESMNRFARLKCLGKFYCSTKTSLHVAEAEDLICPLYLRSSPPPFPSLENLEVNICNSTEDPELLMDSLRWMAPSLKSPISIKQNSSKVYEDYNERLMHDL